MFHKESLGRGSDKPGVCNAVQAGVFLGIRGRAPDLLHPDHLPELPGQPEGDPPDPAIKVNQGIPRAGHPAYSAVEDLGLGSIDLKKGAWGKLKAQATQPFFERVLPPPFFPLSPENYVGLSRIHILVNP